MFGEATKYFHSLTHRHNLKLGIQRVGMMFPVAMLLFNLHTLFYGNQGSAYFHEGESLLLELSVEEYIGLADAL